jgi:hypothetical protein
MIWIERGAGRPSDVRMNVLALDLIDLYLDPRMD